MFGDAKNAVASPIFFVIIVAGAVGGAMIGWGAGSVSTVIGSFLQVKTDVKSVARAEAIGNAVSACMSILPREKCVTIAKRLNYRDYLRDVIPNLFLFRKF